MLKNKPLAKQKTVHMPENSDSIRAMLHSCKYSVFCHAVSVGLLSMSVQGSWHPYRIQVVLVLKDANRVNCMNVCYQLLNVIKINQDIVHNMLISSEAHFHLS